jgi:hypothetical protein
MTTLQARLREDDPAEAELPDADVQEMRRLVVAEAGSPATVSGWSWPPLAVAALVALMVGGGLLAGRRAAERDALVVPIAPETPAAEGERRQLQFSTPGGTRIIWVFDSKFKLKETLP